ncbi:MAG: polysaccharide biosynthesis protein [Proteobacteria bacterium]|nr:polysaccharide biosynthesis protein [Pseudomonadota bacterium]
MAKLNLYQPVSRTLAVLFALPRQGKRALMLTADAVAIPVVMYCALSLRVGTAVALDEPALTCMVAALLVSVPLFARLGLYRAVVRYMGPRAALAIAAGALAATAVLSLGAAVHILPGLGVSTAVIFGALLLVYVGSSRMVLRWALLANHKLVPRVLIYGAGSGGAQLASSLVTSGRFAPVAFIDDNPALWRTTVEGLAVHSPEHIRELVADDDIERILLAIPSLSMRRRREILGGLESLGVHVQTIPGVDDLLSGAARIDEVRDIAVGDILGRDPVPPVPHLFAACITGKSVLVTGAGGSIGSELCRQIIGLGPRRLVLLEMSELALYSIERELRGICARERYEFEIVPLIGNAHHKLRMREILQGFEIQTVYHAAAYKHVPIVEHNVIEGLYNNVFATWHTAAAAHEHGVETLVLVSTDKAVNPTNVMGAAKRLAELVLQGLHQFGSNTRFCMVRFGNVLESSGSVVPLFREQIRQGGPVTVTHPDMIRYFMTIPEAAQLVIQAGAMAEGGDVFVLDMGKPVKIVELARRMIQLSGFSVRDEANPDGDIAIAYTGLRPAEKLFEELLIGQNVMGTAHPRIMRAVEHALPWTEVEGLLEELNIAMRRFDARAAHDILKRAVREYQPDSRLHDLVWDRRNVVPRTPRTEARIAELRPRRPPPSEPAGATTEH